MSIILEPQHSKVPPCRCSSTLTMNCNANCNVWCNVWVHHLGLLQSFPVPALIKIFLVSTSQMNSKRTNWYLRSCLTLELVQSSFVCFNSVLQPPTTWSRCTSCEDLHQKTIYSPILPQATCIVLHCHVPAARLMKIVVIFLFPASSKFERQLQWF